MPHPHIVKLVLNDAQRKKVLNNLRNRLGVFSTKQKNYTIVQDTINHLRLERVIRGEKRIVFEFTILMVPMTINLDQVRGLGSMSYTSLDYSLILDEFNRVTRMLTAISKRSNQPNLYANITLNHIACPDWEIKND